MGPRVRIAVGVVLVVVGVVWALQGLGTLGGSAMTGDPFWAIVGPLVAAGGLALAYSATRRPGA